MQHDLYTSRYKRVQVFWFRLRALWVTELREKFENFSKYVQTNQIKEFLALWGNSERPFISETLDCAS